MTCNMLYAGVNAGEECACRDQVNLLDQGRMHCMEWVSTQWLLAFKSFGDAHQDPPETWP